MSKIGSGSGLQQLFGSVIENVNENGNGNGNDDKSNDNNNDIDYNIRNNNNNDENDEIIDNHDENNIKIDHNINQSINYDKDCFTAEQIEVISAFTNINKNGNGKNKNLNENQNDNQNKNKNENQNQEKNLNKNHNQNPFEINLSLNSINSSSSISSNMTPTKSTKNQINNTNEEYWNWSQPLCFLCRDEIENKMDDVNLNFENFLFEVIMIHSEEETENKIVDITSGIDETSSSSSGPSSGPKKISDSNSNLKLNSASGSGSDNGILTNNNKGKRVRSKTPTTTQSAPIPTTAKAATAATTTSAAAAAVSQYNQKKSTRVRSSRRGPKSVKVTLSSTDLISTVKAKLAEKVDEETLRGLGGHVLVCGATPLIDHNMSLKDYLVKSNEILYLHISKNYIGNGESDVFALLSSTSDKSGRFSEKGFRGSFLSGPGSGSGSGSGTGTGTGSINTKKNLGTNSESILDPVVIEILSPLGMESKVNSVREFTGVSFDVARNTLKLCKYDVNEACDYIFNM